MKTLSSDLGVISGPQHRLLHLAQIEIQPAPVTHPMSRRIRLKRDLKSFEAPESTIDKMLNLAKLLKMSIFPCFVRNLSVLRITNPCVVLFLKFTPTLI